MLQMLIRELSKKSTISKNQYKQTSPQIVYILVRFVEKLDDYFQDSHGVTVKDSAYTPEIFNDFDIACEQNVFNGKGCPIGTDIPVSKRRNPFSIGDNQRAIHYAFVLTLDIGICNDEAR